MIRTVITPDNTSIHLAIPESYIGKQVEVLLYTVDEVADIKPVIPKKMSDFKGIITVAEADQLQEYVKQSRAEWERNF